MQLKQHSIIRNHSRDLLLSSVTSIGFFAITILILIFSNIFIQITKIKYETIPVENPLYSTCLILPTNFNIVFVITIAAVSVRINSVKKVILKESNCVVKKIKIVMKFHDKLHDVFLSLNKFFALNFAVLFLQLISYIILVLFALYDILFNGRPVENLAVFLVGASSFNLVTACVLLTMLSFVGSIRRSELDILKRIVQIENSYESKLVHCHTRLAVLQMKSAPLILSCGLITIDWHIWIIMLASIFNYMIIFIQFDASN